jgi:hypothetical protein
MAGALDGPTATAVARHLTSCLECCEVVQRVAPCGRARVGAAWRGLVGKR